MIERWHKVCDICGQQLTDASGAWNIIYQYLGIMEKLNSKFCCCSACKEKIDESVEKVINERTKERQDRAWR